MGFSSCRDTPNRGQLHRMKQEWAGRGETFPRVQTRQGQRQDWAQAIHKFLLETGAEKKLGTRKPHELWGCSRRHSPWARPSLQEMCWVQVFLWHSTEKSPRTKIPWLLWPGQLRLISVAMAWHKPAMLQPPGHYLTKCEHGAGTVPVSPALTPTSVSV